MLSFACEYAGIVCFFKSSERHFSVVLVACNSVCVERWGIVCPRLFPHRMGYLGLSGPVYPAVEVWLRR